MMWIGITIYLVSITALLVFHEFRIQQLEDRAKRDPLKFDFR